MYCLKVGGRPKEIATNPGGMNMVTIPKEDLEKFKKMATDYKLPYFTVSNKIAKEPYLDICIKMEDTAVLHRILERCEIGVIKEATSVPMEAEVLEEIKNMSSGKSFDEVSAEYKERAETFDGALNRHTDKNFSRDTPYYICERTNPQNYIKIISAIDNFEGKEYTKSNYAVFKNGKAVGTFDDGRFEGRTADYWTNVKEKMSNAGGFTDDLLYFGNGQVFESYQELYDKGKVTVLPERMIEITPETLEKATQDFLRDCRVAEDNVLNPNEEAALSELKTGQKNGNAAKKEGIKPWVEEKEAQLKSKKSLKTVKVMQPKPIKIKQGK